MAVRLGFIFILEMFYLLSDTKFHDSQVKSQNFLNGTFTSSLSEKGTRRDSSNFKILADSCGRGCISCSCYVIADTDKQKREKMTGLGFCRAYVK